MSSSSNRKCQIWSLLLIYTLDKSKSNRVSFIISHFSYQTRKDGKLLAQNPGCRGHTSPKLPGRGSNATLLPSSCGGMCFEVHTMRSRPLSSPGLRWVVPLCGVVAGHGLPVSRTALEQLWSNLGLLWSMNHPRERRIYLNLSTDWDSSSLGVVFACKIVLGSGFQRHLQKFQAKVN